MRRGEDGSSDYHVFDDVLDGTATNWTRLSQPSQFPGAFATANLNANESYEKAIATATSLLKPNISYK